MIHGCFDRTDRVMGSWGVDCPGGFRRSVVWKVCLVFAFACLIVGIDVSLAREWVLESVDGQTKRGSIESYSPNGISFINQESQASVRVPTGQTKTIKLVRTDDELNNQKRRAIQVCFSDGSLAGADDIVLNDGTITLTIEGQLIPVPESFLLSVQFVSLNEQTTKEWSDIFAAETSEDMLIVNRDDSLTYYRGRVRGITAEKVLFELDGDILPVSREKTAGVRLIRTPSELSRSRVARAVLEDGSDWSVSSVEWKENDQKFIVVPQLELDWGAYLDSNRVIALEFPTEKLEYLSDVKPESVQWTPFMSVPGMPQEQLRLFNQPRLNQGFGSQVMSIASQSFEKGICLKSRTEIVFRLTESYSRLRAVAGIDDLARPRGNVDLVIWGDDKELFRRAITGAEPAFELDVPILGVKRLKILVDFGEQAAVGDILTIGSPVLVK